MREERKLRLLVIGPAPHGKQASWAAKAAARKKELKKQTANAQQTEMKPQEEEITLPADMINEEMKTPEDEAMEKREDVRCGDRGCSYTMRAYVKISNFAFRFDHTAYSTCIPLALFPLSHSSDLHGPAHLLGRVCLFLWL